MTEVTETTEYEDAVNYRDNIESGEINKGGFILGSKYLKLLDYMEQQLEVTKEATRLTRKCIAVDNERLEKILTQIQAVSSKQAEDEGLWFDATTAPEAYLQKALRDLHRVIESKALLKDHEIARLVNELTTIAKTYAGTEQLREHISKCVVKWVKS